MVRATAIDADPGVSGVPQAPSCWPPVPVFAPFHRTTRAGGGGIQRQAATSEWRPAAIADRSVQHQRAIDSLACLQATANRGGFWPMQAEGDRGFRRAAATGERIHRPAKLQDSAPRVLSGGRLAQGLQAGRMRHQHCCGPGPRRPLCQQHHSHRVPGAKLHRRPSWSSGRWGRGSGGPWRTRHTRDLGRHGFRFSTPLQSPPQSLRVGLISRPEHGQAHRHRIDQASSAPAGAPAWGRSPGTGSTKPLILTGSPWCSLGSGVACASRSAPLGELRWPVAQRN